MGSGELDVDVARADDSEALQEIAAELSVYSRFAFDPRFGVGQARRLYDRWLKVSLEGRADLFVVARNAGRAVGFVACRVNKHLASLELVAVRSTAVGAGVGTALLHRAARSLRALGCQTVEVITQGPQSSSAGVL